MVIAWKALEPVFPEDQQPKSKYQHLAWDKPRVHTETHMAVCAALIGPPWSVTRRILCGFTFTFLRFHPKECLLPLDIRCMIYYINITSNIVTSDTLGSYTRDSITANAAM